MSLRGIKLKTINLINGLLAMAIVLCICSLFVLHIRLTMPFLFSSIFLSLSELLWAFAIINLSFWSLYKLINKQLFSDKITIFQIASIFFATLSICSIQWWGRLIIHGKRYAETSKLNMLSSPIFFKGITILITIIFFGSIFLFLFNVMMGLVWKYKRFNL